MSLEEEIQYTEPVLDQCPEGGTRHPEHGDDDHDSSALLLIDGKD